MIVVCSFNLVSNIASIMIGEIKKFFKKLRFIYFKWKLANLKKKIRVRKEKEAIKKENYPDMSIELLQQIGVGNRGDEQFMQESQLELENNSEL